MGLHKREEEGGVGGRVEFLSNVLFLEEGKALHKRFHQCDVTLFPRLTHISWSVSLCVFVFCLKWLQAPLLFGCHSHSYGSLVI